MPATKKPKTKKPLNLLYPGKPNYKGKIEGLFSIVHQNDNLVEWSDNIKDRIAWIKHYKASNEVKRRLEHIIYIPYSILPVSSVRRVKALEAAFIKVEEINKLLKIATTNYFDSVEITNDNKKYIFSSHKPNLNKSKKILDYLKKHIKNFNWTEDDGLNF